MLYKKWWRGIKTRTLFRLKGQANEIFGLNLFHQSEPMLIFDFVNKLTTRLQSVKQMAKKLCLTL